MIPEIDIWRAASLMLKRYGEKALDCGRRQNVASYAQCPAVTATQAVAVAASATSAARLSGGRRLTCRRCFRDDLETTRMPLFLWLGA